LPSIFVSRYQTEALPDGQRGERPQYHLISGEAGRYDDKEEQEYEEDIFIDPRCPIPEIAEKIDNDKDRGK